ncbi:MAG: tripartite tricarboxylate transporter TctB family protein [Proteobacteria bacterium]|nr:tripartite tricarboxylate transporter TctB family protein [Pseudomonadota bacterium]
MSTQSVEGRRAVAVPRYARIDVIGGALIVLLAVTIWIGARDLDAGALSRIGTGALPKGLAVILFVAGVAILLRGLMQSNEAAERFYIAVRPAAIVVASIVLFGVFIRGGDFGLFSTPQLGLMIVGPLTVFISGNATPEMEVKRLIVLSFGLTAAMLLVFMDLLSVTIPVFPVFIQEPLTLSLGIDTVVRIAYVGYGLLAALLHVIFFGLPEMRRG